MALGLTAVMAALFRALGPNDTLVVCLYLWALLLSVGSLNEVKASALKWERRRIVFGALLLVSYFWMVSPVFSSIGLVLGLILSYSLVSWVFLLLAVKRQSANTAAQALKSTSTNGQVDEIAGVSR